MLALAPARVARRQMPWAEVVSIAEAVVPEADGSPTIVQFAVPIAGAVLVAMNITASVSKVFPVDPCPVQVIKPFSCHGSPVRVPVPVAMPAEVASVVGVDVASSTVSVVEVPVVVMNPCAVTRRVRPG